MIVLDTNVLSELTRDIPDESVVVWLDSLPVDEVATTAISAAELLYGVARLPDGRRKLALSAAAHSLIHEDFHGRVEPFDASAAAQYALVVGDRAKIGRPIRPLMLRSRLSAAHVRQPWPPGTSSISRTPGLSS